MLVFWRDRVELEMLCGTVRCLPIISKHSFIVHHSSSLSIKKRHSIIWSIYLLGRLLIELRSIWRPLGRLLFSVRRSSDIPTSVSTRFRHINPSSGSRLARNGFLLLYLRREMSSLISWKILPTEVFGRSRWRSRYLMKILSLDTSPGEKANWIKRRIPVCIGTMPVFRMVSIMMNVQWRRSELYCLPCSPSELGSGSMAYDRQVSKSSRKVEFGLFSVRRSRNRCI